ncbi:MAG: hypothetical protein ABSB52_11095 [Acidimicrobiales bacterium]
MRNIWKGLIIGGLTGAGAGAVVDLFDRGARLVATAGHKAVEVTPEAVDLVKAAAAAAERQAAGTAPELANLVKSAVSDGVSRIHEADIGNHLSERTRELVHRVGDSDRAGHVREALDRANKKGKQLAHTVHDATPILKD